MTNEEKQLLITDLSARLPYGVKVMKQFKTQTRTLASVDVVKFRVYFLENDVNSPFGFDIENPLNLSQQIKPYLRPISSMTIEEMCKIETIMGNGFTYRDNELMVCSEDIIKLPFQKIHKLMGFLYQHHIDYNDLIPNGLALEAPKGMYNF